MASIHNLDFSALFSGMFLDGIEDLLFGNTDDEHAESARFVFQAGRLVGRADVMYKMMDICDEFKGQSEDFKKQALDFMRKNGIDDSDEDKS